MRMMRGSGREAAVEVIERFGGEARPRFVYRCRCVEGFELGFDLAGRGGSSRGFLGEERGMLWGFRGGVE